MVHPEELDVNLYFDVVIDEAGFESSRELASAEVQPGGAFRLVWDQPREDKILGEHSPRDHLCWQLNIHAPRLQRGPLKLCLMVD